MKKKLIFMFCIIPVISYATGFDSNLHIGELNMLEGNKKKLMNDINYNRNLNAYIAEEKTKIHNVNNIKSNFFSPNFTKNIYAFNTFVLCSDLGNLISLEGGNTKLFDRNKCFYAIRGSLIQILDAYEGNPYIKLKLFYNGKIIVAFTRKDLFHNGTNCKPTNYSLDVTTDINKKKLND